MLLLEKYGIPNRLPADSENLIRVLTILNDLNSGKRIRCLSKKASWIRKEGLSGLFDALVDFTGTRMDRLLTEKDVIGGCWAATELSSLFRRSKQPERSLSVVDNAIDALEANIDA